MIFNITSKTHFCYRVKRSILYKNLIWYIGIARHVFFLNVFNLFELLNWLAITKCLSVVWDIMQQTTTIDVSHKCTLIQKWTNITNGIQENTRKAGIYHMPFKFLIEICIALLGDAWQMTTNTGDFCISYYSVSVLVAEKQVMFVCTFWFMDAVSKTGTDYNWRLVVLTRSKTIQRLRPSYTAWFYD